MSRESQALRFGVSERDLDATRALILHAYFGLHRTRPGTAIGTREISDWIEAQEPDIPVPSAAVIQRTLVAAGVVHRGRGQPRHDSRSSAVQEATPLLPVRPTPPRMQAPK
jgi:hypothetical protein